MEKISAFFVIFFLVSLCMVTVTVGDICHTDQDCIDIGIPRCKRTGKMPICYDGYCSCFPRRRPAASTTAPSTSNS
ncbi:defensin-like protein 311 [Raphanus sativus]|uniref:Defensin-like protein 311 n=1 Tax=Raphanus sativus TaxID=3726 RepID=A0A6J0P192_RAPSA|nr:defensin-like protein 311 [Raphanus sativus]